MPRSASGDLEGGRRACKAYPMQRAFIGEAGNAEGDCLHEYTRALVERVAAAGTCVCVWSSRCWGADGPRFVSCAELATSLLASLPRHCQRGGGRLGHRFYGQDVARVLRKSWPRVFAGVDTSEAQEERFLMHTSSDRLDVVEFPLDFVSRALVGRRDSAPGPDGLWCAAFAATWHRFEGALSAHLRRFWDGDGLAPPDRVVLTCFLPKDALVEGVVERVALCRFVASLVTQCLASALPAHVDETQKGFHAGAAGDRPCPLREIGSFCLGFHGGDAAGHGLRGHGGCVSKLVASVVVARCPEFCGQPVADMIADMYHGASK